MGDSQPGLRAASPWGDIGGHRRMAMLVLTSRRTLLSLSLVVVVSAPSYAQNVAPARATAAWTLKTAGEVRWHQVTPAGRRLNSPDAQPPGGNVVRGQGQ